MTPEEAIVVFDKMLKRYDWAEDNKSVQAIKVAKECIEKQIPKKVTKSVCPSCNRIFLFKHSEKRKGDYCDNCGQALDWSDAE